MENNKKEILVIDDDPSNLRTLQEILKDQYTVYASPSPSRALSFLEGKIPNLILLDIRMPEMDGYEVIKILKNDDRWKDIPIIFLTALEGRESEEKAFELGAVDYVVKPIIASVVLARVGVHIELQSYQESLQDMVDKRTEQLQKTQDALLEMLANVTATRDNETGAHIKRTTYYTKALVDNLLDIKHRDYIITKDYAEALVKSAKLHDVGKVAIPDSILLKPGKLTFEEFEIIKKHTVFGGHILDQAIDELGEDSYFLSVAREIIMTHHEKWDGGGYPNGLVGNSIPIAGRIMAIADVYDALISERPYKKPFSHEKAMEIILEDTGTHFDPTLMNLSLETINREFPLIAKEYVDENYELKIYTHVM